MRILLNWINNRFPLNDMWETHATKYATPKNFNFWYYFGVFSILVLVNQLVTGVWLTMYYTPTANAAFASVQHIMRDVKFGWLLRYMHTTGASAFFIVVYLHMYRCVMYGSYQKPRELIWLFGMCLYVLLLSEAFTGYALPWGQMSFWATKVIMSLFDAIPWVGHYMMHWIQGDYAVSTITLGRFFSYHVTILPMLIVAIVVFHIASLHKVGSNNPDGIDIDKSMDRNRQTNDAIPFHPYYTVKDLCGVVVFLIVFCTVLFFAPSMGGYFLEPENFVPANHLITPEHIAPVWYMAPFYAILRAVPNKLMGIIAMTVSVAMLFVMPWLDRSPVRSLRYKGVYSKVALTIFVISFVGLGYIGTQPPLSAYTTIARVFTIFYFLFFVLMPFYTRYEKTKEPPTRLTPA